MGGLTAKQTILAAVLLAILVALGFGYRMIGSPDPSILFFGFAFVIAALVFVRILAMFLLDAVQYAREGWNIEQRPPRADFRIGRARRKMQPRTIMWLGYPLFLLAFGGASLLLGLQVFGAVRLF